MNIVLRFSSGRTEDFEVDPQFRIIHLKEAIEQREGIETQDLILLFDSNRIENDLSTLESYAINHGSVIDVIVQKPSSIDQGVSLSSSFRRDFEMVRKRSSALKTLSFRTNSFFRRNNNSTIAITVAALSGKEELYHVSPQITVSFLKQAIKERLDVAYGKIKLLFGAKHLEDDTTLESYNIKEGSKILMVIKMIHQSHSTLALCNTISDINKDLDQNTEANTRSHLKPNIPKQSTYADDDNRHSSPLAARSLNFGKDSPPASPKIRGYENKSGRSVANETKQIKTYVHQLSDEDKELIENKMMVNQNITSCFGEQVTDDPLTNRKMICSVPITPPTHEIYRTGESEFSVKDRNKCFKLIIYFGIGVVCCGIGVAILWYIIDSTHVEPTQMPSAAPSMDETLPPINENLVQKLVLNNISQEDDLRNINSPQHNALVWLHDQNHNKTNIVQQYSFATVAIGLGAKPFLEDNIEYSECFLSWTSCDENMSLSSIDLKNFNLQGELLTEIRLLPNLKRIDISHNTIGGSIPTEIGDLILLETLKISNNKIAGTIPEELLNLKLLQILEVGGNLLTGHLPSGIWRLNNLKRLSLFGNGFTGSIPKSISNLSSLESFDATTVDFDGTIPTGIGNLTNLKRIDIGTTYLHGHIPTEIGLLDQLSLFYLGYNIEITGTLPSEFGNLKQLEVLMVVGNSLIGSIPPELGDMENIVCIRIEDERLLGTIPTEMGRLNKLKQAVICNTGLTGNIPKEWCDLGITPITDLNCSCCRNRCKRSNDELFLECSSYDDLRR